MSDSLLTLAASTVLGGGLLAASVNVYTARKKVPVERDSIAVGGAETAVLALERSLSAETRRADRAEAEVIRLQAVISDRDGRIAALEQRLDSVQAGLDDAREELRNIKTISDDERHRIDDPPSGF